MTHEIRFTPAELADIDSAMALLENVFAKLIALDSKQRRRMFKMGSKSEAFCRQALTILDKNRQLAPPALDLDGALDALRTIDELRPRAKRLLALATRMQHSEVALGGHVATAARQGYKSLGEYGERHGLGTMRQSLSTRFSRRRKPSSGSDTGAAS